MIRLRATAAVCAVAVLAPGVARAQDSEQERKRRAYALIQEGQARFDLGKFDEAIVLFANAYEIWPYPEALYNLAQAHRMKKDYEKAIFFYKSYLRNKPDAENRAQVEARIAELEALRAEQEREAREPPTGTTGPAEPPGGPAPIDTPPGRVDVRPRAPEVWWRDDWGWVLVVGGAAAAGAGLWLLGEADRMDVEADDEVDSLRITELRDGARHRRIGGWSAVGLGVVGVVLGGVRLYRTDPGSPAPQARRFQLLVGPGGIGVTGRF